MPEQQVTAPDSTTRLVAVDDRHTDRILDWLADEELRDYIGTVYPVSRRAHLQRLEHAASDATRLVLAIEHGPASDHVGMAGLTGIDLIYRNAEVWLYLGESADRGKGIGKAAFQQLAAFAFGTLGLNRIYAHVFSFNEGALRFFQACGMSPEGVLREAVFKRGRFWHKHVFGLLCREFEPDAG